MYQEASRFTVDVDATGHMHVLVDKWAALKEEV